jgi:putative tricarboxylic transport membrane protein
LTPRALPLLYFSFSILGGASLAGSLSLPMGTVEQPGPGVFPLAVAVFILSLSIPALLLSLKTGAAHESVFPGGTDRRRVIAVACAVFFFVLFLKPLGYAPCCAVMMAAVLRLLGMRSWPKTVAAALVTAILSYYIFSSLLEVPLPRGSLFS